jgi:hypothetical protein
LLHDFEEVGKLAKFAVLRNSVLCKYQRAHMPPSRRIAPGLGACYQRGKEKQEIKKE